MQRSVGVANDKEYYCVCRESQPRVGWKGPLDVVVSNPAAQEGHLEQVVQDGVQSGFLIICRGADLATSLGNLLQFDHCI